jgi:hypothetical protein
MTTTHTTTTEAARVIADASDLDAVREASVAMAVAAVVRLRGLAELATVAAAAADEAAALILNGEDAGDRLRTADAMAAGVLGEAREARQCITLAIEGDDLAGGRRCACGELMSDGDPRDACAACDLAPFGPEWERELADRGGW